MPAVQCSVDCVVHTCRAAAHLVSWQSVGLHDSCCPITARSTACCCQCLSLALYGSEWPEVGRLARFNWTSLQRGVYAELQSSYHAYTWPPGQRPACGCHCQVSRPPAYFNPADACRFCSAARPGECWRYIRISKSVSQKPAGNVVGWTGGSTILPSLDSNG